MNNEKILSVNTLLIDADSLLYYEAYKESVEDAIQGLNNRLERIFNETNCNRYILFLTEGKCFRYKKAKSSPYKGNRKDKVKQTWFNTLRSYMKEKYFAVSIPELEADDCVAYFANKFENSIICSPDKDVIKQCHGTHYNYQFVAKRDKEGNKIEGQFESKGYLSTTLNDATLFLYTQWLTGDSTDSISGIEKVGPKTAEKWLKEWENDDISTEQHILSKYIEKYGKIKGTCKFSETFYLVYLLKTDEDMIREIGYVPEIPIPQLYIPVEECIDEVNIKW